MINKIYIESAKNIRYEFLNLSKKLDTYQKELTNLFSYLEGVSVELQEISKNEVSKIRSKADATNVTDHIIKKMNEIEAEEQKLIRLITPINDRIDKLRDEEKYLYNQIKEKYPLMTEDEIKKEIQSHLEK